jgi:hypothetical protein
MIEILYVLQAIFCSVDDILEPSIARRSNSFIMLSSDNLSLLHCFLVSVAILQLLQLHAAYLLKFIVAGDDLFRVA